MWGLIKVLAHITLCIFVFHLSLFLLFVFSTFCLVDFSSFQLFYFSTSFCLFLSFLIEKYPCFCRTGLNALAEIYSRTDTEVSTSHLDVGLIDLKEGLEDRNSIRWNSITKWLSRSYQIPAMRGCQQPELEDRKTPSWFGGRSGRGGSISIAY